MTEVTKQHSQSREGGDVGGDLILQLAAEVSPGDQDQASIR